MKQNNNNFSVLPFYANIDEQNHRKSYAYGAIYPLYAPKNVLLPFQIMREQRRNEIIDYVDIASTSQDEGRFGWSNIAPIATVVHQVRDANYQYVDMPGYYYYYYKLPDFNQTYKISGLNSLAELDNVPRTLFSDRDTATHSVSPIYHNEETDMYFHNNNETQWATINNKVAERATNLQKREINEIGSYSTFNIDSGKRYQAKVDALSVEYPFVTFLNTQDKVTGEQYITQEQLGEYIELRIPVGTTKIIVNSDTQSAPQLQRLDVTYELAQIEEIKILEKDGEEVADITTEIKNAGLQIVPTEDFDVILFPANVEMPTDMNIGMYYLSMTDGVDMWYSEIFTIVEDITPYLKIEWWDVENLIFDSGIIIYDVAQFKNVLYLCTELGKPEYNYEEEGEKRDGYFFPTKQLSEKTYKCTILAAEFLCDVMRFIRMADNVRITDQYGRIYNADTFLITPKWQTQGDLASVEIEFETDTVVKKLGKGYTTP